jgi:similar to stage IV sporulation protein
MKKRPELFFKGYYIILVPTDKLVRLMNYCRAKDICLYEIYKNDDETRLIVSHKDYKALEVFFEKAQIECKILESKGLAALFFKRSVQLILGFFLLLLFGVVIINGYIWNITVTGSTYYTDEQIKSWISENAVSIGSKKKQITCSDLEHAIREGLQNIEWVSCSIRGTTLVVDVYDKKGDLKTDDYSGSGENEYSDVVSESDCIITEIIPVSGTAVVAVGDKVKKGDILISAEITIYNDYGEQVDTAYVDAKGYVTGLITDNFNETITEKSQEKTYEDCIKSFALGFGDANISIFSPKITSQYDLSTVSNNLRIGNSFYLPFSVVTYEIYPYSVIQTDRDKTELKSIMTKRISAYVSALQKKGVEIVENNVKMYFDENGCTAKGSILYKKNVGYKGD